MIEQIIKIIKNTTPNSTGIHLKKLNGIEKYLKDNNYSSISELIHCITNNIIEKPICELEGCNNFKKFDKNKKYTSGCSKSHTTMITCLGKYGVDNASKSIEVVTKIKKTNLEKYGMHPSQRESERLNTSNRSARLSEQVTKSIKETCLQKYGVTSFSKTDDFKIKYTETMIRKYGVEHNLKSDSVGRKKRDNTMLEKYGVVNALENVSIKQKAIKKFNKNHILYRLKNIKNCSPLFDITDYSGVENYYKWSCNDCGNEFDYKIDDGKNPICPKCYPRTRSKIENEILDIFKNQNICHNYRQLRLNGNVKELDILLNYKIGIELNGNYWHSESNGKYKNYHLEKTKICSDNNIQLLHFFEDEWILKKDILISIIKAKLNILDTKIFARNCIVKIIDIETTTIFLNKNHIQGSDNSTINIGLFYHNTIVCVMTFGKSKFDNTVDYEMYRFCSLINTRVIGGASKLLKYFIKNYKPKSIVTYADKRYSDGLFYEKIGFKKCGSIPPNFFVLGKNKLDRQSHLNWEKHMIKEKLNMFDDKKTIYENLLMNGYDRIWDCGSFKFKWVEK